MSNGEHHITSYWLIAKVLIFLLCLTGISVLVTWFHLGAFSVAVALLLASIKVTAVLTYFMHLKFDNLLFRILVIGVFSLFILIIIVTFSDYLFR